MKKAMIIVALVVTLFALMGCTTINAPHSVGSASIQKTGTASGQIILYVFGEADFGIATAAKNGGITKIATVDVETKQLLGIITTYTTTVTGE